MTRVGVAVGAELVQRTPKDTRKASINWLISWDKPRREVFEVRDEAAAVASNFAAINGVHGRELWISNNVPYIRILDTGTSTQAPRGFIRIALRKGAKTVKGAKVLD